MTAPADAGADLTHRAERPNPFNRPFPADVFVVEGVTAAIGPSDDDAGLLIERFYPLADLTTGQNLLSHRSPPMSKPAESNDSLRANALASAWALTMKGCGLLSTHLLLEPLA